MAAAQIMMRNLPLSCSSTLLHAYEVPSDACENFLAVPDSDRVNVYDVGDVMDANHLRLKSPVFSTRAIPLRMRLNELPTFTRITCLTLQSDHLWVGTYDGTVRVWNWRTGELKKTRTYMFRDAKPTKMFKFNDDVMVMWSNHTLAQFNIDTGGQFNTVQVNQDLPLLRFQASNAHELTLSANIMDVKCPNRDMRLVFTNLMFTAGTILAMGHDMHVYASMQRRNPDATSSLIVHYKLSNVRTDTEFAKDEQIHALTLHHSTVTSMITFSEKLAVSMHVNDHSMVIIYCARTMVQQYYLNLQQFKTNINMAVINQKGSNERLMVMSGTIHMDLIAPKWKENRQQLCWMIAAMQKSNGPQLPVEIVQFCLQFL